MRVAEVSKHITVSKTSISSSVCRSCSVAVITRDSDYPVFPQPRFESWQDLAFCFLHFHCCFIHNSRRVISQMEFVGRALVYPEFLLRKNLCKILAFEFFTVGQKNWHLPNSMMIGSW